MSWRGSIVSASVWVMVAVAVAGCDPRDLPLFDDGGAPGQTGGTSGASGSGGTGVPGSGGTGVGGATVPVTLPPGVTPGPYATVSKVAGDCATASGGTQVASPSLAEVASLLVGRWQFCSGSPLMDLGGAGMEFARDRHWRRLDMSAGVLVPATGFDSDGVWYMTAEDPNDMLVRANNVVRILLSGHTGATGYGVDFIQSPTRLRLGGTIYIWRGE